MPFNLFKLKKRYAPKGNTIKKPESIDGRQARRDFYTNAINDKEGVVNHENVDNWIKEGVSESPSQHPKDSDMHEKAVLQPRNGPRHATWVDVLAAPISSNGGLEAMPTSPLAESGEASVARESISNDDTPKERKPSIFDIIVGQQNPLSPYFTGRYVRLSKSQLPQSWHQFRFPVENASGSSLVYRPDLDFEALKLYQLWLQSGTIIAAVREMKSVFTAMDDKYVWQSYWPLMNAHILGCTIKEPDFANLVMDVLEQAVTKGVCPDNDTITRIFSTDGECISDVLKQFVVDR
jgi:hypothetical protein